MKHKTVIFTDDTITQIHIQHNDMQCYERHLIRKVVVSHEFPSLYAVVCGTSKYIIKLLKHCFPINASYNKYARAQMYIMYSVRHTNDKKVTANIKVE